ncbi:MAG: DNA repair protein RecN [Fusobacteriaceae bacterium]|jgi:DNA repair protein RecN (Recombination protein N)|nr:DNA repair protein RecN [Fusobacteriaceae bacterium]
MLKELRIENLAIIKNVSMEFDEGLVVLTGETGAGKSIILSGINLLIGEKASFDMIRSGEENLIAQGIFSLTSEQAKEVENLGIMLFGEQELIIRRIYDRSGKGKAFVNDARVTLNALRDIAENLIDIVGQHSHQMLLHKGNHIKLLDQFLGEEGKRQKESVFQIYRKYIEINRKIEETENFRKENKEKRELYSFQLQEIDKVNPRPEEDVLLEDEYKRMFHAEMIREKIAEGRIVLSGREYNILSLLKSVVKSIESIAKYGEEYGELLERLEKAWYEIEDCDDILKTLESGIEVDERELARMSDRLDALALLKRKYGATVGEILEYRCEIAQQLQNYDDSAEESHRLRGEKEKIAEEYRREAEILSRMRREKAAEIKSLLERELCELNMENARFEARIAETGELSANGLDDVEFFISTNAGEEVKPLWKIASGGEVSRIMLALKVIFSRVDNIPILIFDEIDTGVGGETIRKIAAKLKNIGSHTQVISITHSPIIASKAMEQLLIKKETRDNATVTLVEKLTPEDRVLEIARMLAGEAVTPSVLAHARELLSEI